MTVLLILTDGIEIMVTRILVLAVSVSFMLNLGETVSAQGPPRGGLRGGGPPWAGGATFGKTPPRFSGKPIGMYRGGPPKFMMTGNKQNNGSKRKSRGPGASRGASRGEQQDGRQSDSREQMRSRGSKRSGGKVGHGSRGQRARGGGSAKGHDHERGSNAERSRGKRRGM